MKIIHQFEEAWALLNAGKIIAYPTEAVYGLGCDPFNKYAVNQLLALKQRPEHKGLIILISNWLQLEQLTLPIDSALLEPVLKSWPGPVTWVFPKSSLIPEWVSGQHPTVAIRMSAHPTAQQICKHGPVVSTSANLSGLSPAMNFDDLQGQFPDGIDGFIVGDLGGAIKPTDIFDVCSGKRLR